VSGTSGSSGTSGAAGANGSSGTSGSSGATGAAGAKGTSGSSGNSCGSPFLTGQGNNACPDGYAHSITNSDWSVIMSGYENCITSNCTTADSNNNFIAGGTLNIIAFDQTGAVVGEVGYSSCNFIGGGNTNKICARQNQTGNIGFSFDNAVVGGLQNHICAFNTGGQTVGTIASSFIGGGFQNRICVNTRGDYGSCNAILGSKSNYIEGNEFTVIGGNNISVSGSYTQQAHFNAISKVTNNFKISHPDPTKCSTHFLTHSTMETPTAGDNIYRYEVETVSCKASFELPSYYKFLNENDQVWITPKDHHGKAWACVTNDQTKVCVNSDTDGKYYVLVIGTRKDECAIGSWQGVERYKIPTHIVDYK